MLDGWGDCPRRWVEKRHQGMLLITLQQHRLWLENYMRREEEDSHGRLTLKPLLERMVAKKQIAEDKKSDQIGSAAGVRKKWYLWCIGYSYLATAK